MRGLRLTILLGAAFAALSAASACSGGGTGGGDTSSTSNPSTSTGTGGATTSSTTSTGGTGGTTTSSTTSSTGSTGGATTSSSSAGGSDAGTPPGYCTKPCAAAADCCPPGDPNCPGPTYPNNVACTNGACYAPECSATSDCTALNPKLDCFSLSGFDDCAFACASDADCTAPLTCSGVDDNNKKFCLSAGGGCTDDASCNGLGKCVNKVCVCDVDNDCTKPGFTKCAK
jgi:hypothetical protein